MALWNRGAGAPTSPTCRPMSGLESGHQPLPVFCRAQPNIRGNPTTISVQRSDLKIKTNNTNSMGYIRSVGQDRSWLLWNPRFDYRVHKILPPDDALSQFNPCHTITPSPLEFVSSCIRPDIQMSGSPFKCFILPVPVTCLAQVILH